MIKMRANDTTFEVNGKKIENDVPPLAINNRTYVPLRFISEHMGLNVDWDKETNIVTVYGRKKYFNTADECAADWAMHFNAMSTAIYRELAGIIYKDSNGFYWDGVKVGNDQEVYLSPVEIKKGVAGIHSHGGDKPSRTWQMSQGDRKVANNSCRPLYMADSGGKLWILKPHEKNQTQIADGLVISSKWATDAEFESCAKNMCKYFRDGYFGLADEFSFGFVADYYNRMYMKGIRDNENI